MSQLAFRWPVRPSYAPQDFIVSEANAQAVRFLEGWPSVNSCAALLSGPEACGKTHLAACWAARTQAIVIDSERLGKTPSPELWGTATHAVLEDIHTITRQTALFHLLRHAETQGLFLLLTARAPAEQLHFALADLRSRLRALPAAAIHAPDEELLKVFLFKCFADRQLKAGDEAIEYLLKRMERTFAAALALVDLLEARALASGRDITVALARSVLA
jgi:chromosomal replication initiation ATPase DnaA